MESATDASKPDPKKRGRPDERVSMTPEEAGKALDRMLGKQPAPAKEADEEPRQEGERGK